MWPLQKPTIPYLDRLPNPLPQSFPKIRHRFELASHTRGFFHLLNAYQLHDKKVLDIGCSYGEFLLYFKQGSVGVTTTEFEVAMGKELGLQIEHGNVNQRECIEHLRKFGPFDVIFAVNIFEHVDSPHVFLRALHSLATEHTRLILGVPVFPSPHALMRVPKFAGSLAQEHINFFTAATLAETVRRSGWDIEDQRPFFFGVAWLDRLINRFCPQQYVIGKKIHPFTYNVRRQADAHYDMKQYYF